MGIGKRLLDLLFPPKCAFCKKLVSAEDGGICPECRKTLPYTKDGGRQKVDFLTTVVAPLYYEDTVRASLLRYKFHGVTALAEAYGPILADTIRAELDGAYDLLTWVPLSRRRLRRRGFDQAKLLAGKTADALGTELVPLLRKDRDVPAQSGVGSAEKRRANISGCYTVIDPAQVAGKRILILDDIVTTGATLSECARVLMLAGAESVSAAALARSRA